MNERSRILDLLAKGKITVDEAERLLDAVRTESPDAAEPAVAMASGEAAGGPPKGKPRFLRVKVDGNDGEKVNVRVPLGLLRAGLKLKSLLPEKARTQFKVQTDSGVHFNLDDLDGKPIDEIVQVLQELSIDVDGKNGETVKIFCE